MSNASIYWFKNDQRLLDNEGLCQAVAYGQPVLSIFIIDPRWFNTIVYGERKADRLRFEFLVQSLKDLKSNLKELGANLDIQVGHPETILPKLSKEHHISHIYCEQEYADEELRLLDRVKANLSKETEIVTCTTLQIGDKNTPLAVITAALMSFDIDITIH